MSLHALLAVDNAQSHVTAFRPISEAAHSWSYDKDKMTPGGSVGRWPGILASPVVTRCTTAAGGRRCCPCLPRHSISSPPTPPRAVIAPQWTGRCLDAADTAADNIQLTDGVVRKCRTFVPSPSTPWTPSTLRKSPSRTSAAFCTRT